MEFCKDNFYAQYQSIYIKKLSHKTAMLHRATFNNDF